MRKTGFRRNILIAYVLAFTIVGTVIGLSRLLHQPPQPACVLHGPWEISIEGSSLGTRRVPFYITGDSAAEFRQGVYTARISFTQDSDYRQPVIVLPYTNANALSVRLNGTLLGTVGDMRKGRSSRWNAPHLFSVPEGLLSGDNLLELRLFGLYEAGISASPYLTGRKTATGHFLILSQLNHQFIAYAFGSILLLAFVFLLTGRAIDQGKRERVFIAGALFGLALYLTDYLVIEALPVPYHIYKRIALIGLYISIMLSIPGFFGYTHKRMNLPARIAMLIPAASALAIAVLPHDIFDVRNIYTYGNFSILPLIAVLHTALYPRLKRDRRSLWILMGLTALTLLALRDVLIVVFDTGMPILSHYGIILLEIALSFALIGEMLEYYSRMVSLKQWADTVYQESMRDPLTGALNRKILDTLKRINPDSFSLILLDLDDFKYVNDHHGHGAGDKVLKVLVETLVLNIRKTDYVVRLGGDEFAVILFSCDLPTAEKTAEMLNERIAGRTVSHKNAEISIGCSMGVGEVTSAHHLDARIEEIDRLLYHAKKSGKGTVVSDRGMELARRIFAG
jgi:diguanylate cyclase (GGDEF)-like protein